MKQKHINNIGLLMLAVIFSTGLFFAFVELPALLDQFLQTRVGFPQFDHGMGDLAAFKTELFIEGLHLRFFGYLTLSLILLFIVIGYATQRSGWAMAGAIGLFIPVFGQFAFSMFFLAGLGFLRVGWLPFLEISSFNILDLGRVIYLPYWILEWFFGLFNWNAHDVISYFFMGLGAFLFTWGVLVWFQSHYRGKQIASAWIYKISRHPQYLGWILWSYGLILFSPFSKSMKISWSIPSSLPWLLMTMIIIGICLLEEIRMMEKTGGKYGEYRSSSPFLLPLPPWLNRVLSWPARKISHGNHPTRRRQVLWIVLLYTALLMGISLIWVDFDRKERVPESAAEARIELAERMEEIHAGANERRHLHAPMTSLSDYGPAGIDSLMALAADTGRNIREFAIQILGNHRIEKAEDLFLHALSDSIWRVRRSAITALGQIGSKKAVDLFIPMLEHSQVSSNRYQIYSSLGDIGDPRAIPAIAKGLIEGEHWNQTAALDAILKLDGEQGLDYAIAELSDSLVKVRRHAVIMCIRSGDPRCREALEDLYRDEDFEVRFYARQGVNRLKKSYL